jgi:hypothetical protein
MYFYVFMILRPAARFLISPFPPFAFAARDFAAVILPPLVFFTTVFSCLAKLGD